MTPLQKGRFTAEHAEYTRQVMEESRAKAEEQLSGGKPQFRFMGVIVIGIWLLAILLLGIVFGKIFLARK